MLLLWLDGPLNFVIKSWKVLENSLNKAWVLLTCMNHFPEYDSFDLTYNLIPVYSLSNADKFTWHIDFWTNKLTEYYSFDPKNLLTLPSVAS